MSSQKRGPSSGSAWLLAAFAALVLLSILAAWAEGGLPGTYYDEVIQAEPAARFLEPEATPFELPGATQVRVGDRWLPVMTQPYMGALKSQALIPFFALFGTDVTSLRATTLAWALLGLLLLMLWARLAFGPAAAWIAGALVATDPGFFFIARHDWGSFSLGFLCRCGALYLVTSGWTRTGSSAVWLALAAGLLLGLGVYNKIDFAVVVIAAGLAALVVRPRLVRELVEMRRGPLLAAAAGAIAGAGPLLASLGATWRTARGALAREAPADDWVEKLETGLAMLDGSYFERLMTSGGNFVAMWSPEHDALATASPFPFVLVLAIALLVTRWVTTRPPRSFDRFAAFVLVATGLVAIGILATPRAIRIHHALLLVPLPQLVVAAAARDLWRGGGLARAAAGIGVAVALLGNGWVIERTLETIRESGGGGRWSDSIAGFADELTGETVVSLDWGLHLPLRFANREAHLVEPIWQLRAQAQRGRPWSSSGDTDHVYLVFPEAHAVFDYGGQFLAAVRRLPAETWTLREHRDRLGETAFLSVRLQAPHEIRYRRGFEISLARVDSDSRPRAPGGPPE